MDHFVGDAPQFDDITMLGLTFNCMLGENEISVILKDELREAVDVFTQNLVSKLEVIPRVANKIHIIFIVKKMAESMEYAYENNKNILKIIIALA